MSVMMSVMKTLTKPVRKKKSAAEKELPREFTVRDMNRNTALVLAASRKYGCVVVKHRNGEQFEVMPSRMQALEQEAEERKERARLTMEKMERHWQRLRDMGMRGPTTPEGIERINQIIAGEI